MKFLQLTYHFEYDTNIEEILDRHDVTDYVRVSMVEGRDEEGKHFGSQVHPGNTSLIQAQVDEDTVDPLLEDLGEFKREKQAHQHLEAVILPVERRLE